ncbi:hypothetical protein G6F55_008167 [Rhizopus delemar]|uniref:Endonuclease/exonuclease/phosphatase domain-containing protein n=2 Tax=Rhizopus TaxID=4842 RepID=A0A9P7CQN5_9FUNG|nr:hypothetical protein G6F55_008167 [Rhizopus delemar]KAG1522459.1 hypothetical protein G6F52_005841 [Rhizopus delemar]KAG1571218.1 hypothetical protein G6F50_004808 [Rhizopus delemar]
MSTHSFSSSGRMSTTKPPTVVPTGVSSASISIQDLFSKFQELEQRVSYHDGLLRQLEELQAENAHLKKMTNEQSEEIATLRAKLGSVTSSGHSSSTKITKTISQVGNVTTASAISAMENGNVNPVPSGTEASTWAAVAANDKPRNKVRRRLAAARGFQPVSGDQGFEYVYITKSRRMSYSEARRRLSRLGVDNWRVLDVCLPAHSVAGLLVHLQYKPVLLGLLERVKVPVLSNFDPLDPQHLADPAYASASMDTRLTAIATIVNERCSRTLERLRYPVAVAVSKFFLANAMVSDEAVSEVFSSKGDRPTIRRHRDDPVEDMAMDLNTDYYNASSRLVSDPSLPSSPSIPLSQSTPSTHTSSLVPLTIGLWNANGLQASTVDDLLRHCQPFSLVFITETWLLPPARFPTSWQLFHLYGSPAAGQYRGSMSVCAFFLSNTTIRNTTRVSLSRSKHSSFAIELETWFRSNETDVTENSYTVASNEWMDGTRPDVVYTVKDKPTAINPHILIEFQDKVSRDFMSRLINYSLFAYHGYKVYPIDLVFVIKGFSSVSVEKEFIVASEKPFLKIESKFWTKECLLLLAKSILGYIGQSPMDPMVAMGYFLTSGAVSLGSLEHQLDPTLLFYNTPMPLDMSWDNFEAILVKNTAHLESALIYIQKEHQQEISKKQTESANDHQSKKREFITTNDQPIRYNNHSSTRSNLPNYNNNNNTKYPDDHAKMRFARIKYEERKKAMNNHRPSVNNKPNNTKVKNENNGKAIAGLEVTLQSNFASQNLKVVKGDISNSLSFNSSQDDIKTCNNHYDSSSKGEYELFFNEYDGDLISSNRDNNLDLEYNNDVNIFALRNNNVGDIDYLFDSDRVSFSSVIPVISTQLIK